MTSAHHGTDISPGYLYIYIYIWMHDVEKKTTSEKENQPDPEAFSFLVKGRNETIEFDKIVDAASRARAGRRRRPRFYIYIYIERERERELPLINFLSISYIVIFRTIFLQYTLSSCDRGQIIHLHGSESFIPTTVSDPEPKR